VIVAEEEYLEHYGKKGMRWGQRRAAKKEAKATAKKEHEKKVKEFTNSVIKDIGSRSPSELYAVKGSHGRLIVTGEEFASRVNMGMTFTSVQSTGQKINDGR
jgi:hypothetical protein